MVGKWIAERLFPLLVAFYAARRPANLKVGELHPEGPYLHRWYITPWRAWYDAVPKAERTRWQRFVVAATRRTLPNLYLHKFMRDDEDRALHDHPSWAISFILWGGYVEHTIAEGGIHHRKAYGPGSLRFMRTRHTHRVELHREPTPDGGTYARPCWTLFLFGPTRRDWGFHCPHRGWVPWEEFTADGLPGEVGKGCDA